MEEDIRIERVNRDVQTYRVGLPEGGCFTFEYSKRKADSSKCETLSMKFPEDDVWEKLHEVCRIDLHGIHTTPSVAEKYNKLPKEVRDAVIERVSPEAENLLRMI